MIAFLYLVSFAGASLAVPAGANLANHRPLAMIFEHFALGTCMLFVGIYGARELSKENGV